MRLRFAVFGGARRLMIRACQRQRRLSCPGGERRNNAIAEFALCGCHVKVTTPKGGFVISCLRENRIECWFQQVGMPVHVRRIGHAEAVRNGNVIVEAYAEAPWQESWSGENATARLEELTRTPGSVGFAAFDQELLIGFVFALPHTAAIGPGLQIAEMAILPRYQRQRIGSTLLSSVETEARALGYLHIWLVSRLNGGVAGYYRASGYEQSTTLGVYTKRIA